MWCVLGNHGLGWKSKLFSEAKNVKKSEKAHFLELQVGPAIFQTLYELGASRLDYSTRYNHCLKILHHPWLGVKSKLFSWAKNVKKWKRPFFGTLSSTNISQTLYEPGTSGLAYSTWSMWNLGTVLAWSDLIHVTLWRNDGFSHSSQ